MIDNNWMIDNFIEVNSLYTAKCSIAVKLKLALGSIYKGDEGPAQRCTSHSEDK